MTVHRNNANKIRDPQEWNATHPVGTAVRYFPLRSSFDHIDTRTRSEAWIVGGQAVVLVDGVSGGVSLEHLVVAP